MQNNDILKLPILYRGKRKNHFFAIKNNQTIDLFSDELDVHFAQGDIIEIDHTTKKIKTVLSSLSNENTLLLTEQCENRCIFCSQPPNNLPDTHLYQNAAMALLNYNTSKIVGLTGGEPTINQDAFIALLKILNDFNVLTPLHILTNGRNLGNIHFFNRLVKVSNTREIIWGVPLYGHKSSLHDRIVGSIGAFEDTLNGLLNLSSTLHEIELRIVIVKQNYKHIKDILEFMVPSQKLWVNHHLNFPESMINQ